MLVKLSTTIGNISSITNSANSIVVYEFSQVMKSIGTSDNYQHMQLHVRYCCQPTPGDLLEILPAGYCLNGVLVQKTVDQDESNHILNLRYNQHRTIASREILSCSPWPSCLNTSHIPLIGKVCVIEHKRRGMYHWHTFK